MLEKQDVERAESCIISQHENKSNENLQLFASKNKACNRFTINNISYRTPASYDFSNFETFLNSFSHRVSI